MLKTLQEKYKCNWKNHKKLTFAYNNTKHRTTGYSPHLLLIELPVDIIFRIKDNNFQQTNYDSYFKNWQKAISDAHKIVKQNINKINSNNVR